jgi:hypothetical protein
VRTQLDVDGVPDTTARPSARRVVRPLGTSRRSTRRRIAACVATAATIVVSVVGTTPAFAATIKIGRAAENNKGVSYAVPAGAGALTRWSTQGGPNGGQMQFEVWRKAPAGKFTLVYISAAKSLTANVLNTFALSPHVVVDPGDLLGYRAVTATDCAFRTNKTTDHYAYNTSGTVPAVGAVVPFVLGQTGFRFNMSAVAK